MSNSLVSVDELKVFIGVAEGVADFDAQLLSLAKSSTALLSTFCRRDFTYAAITEIFSTRDTFVLDYDLGGGIYSQGNQSGLLIEPAAQRFVLKAFPLDTEADIVVNYDPKHIFGSETVVDSDDYFIDAVGNALYLKKPTGKTVRGLMITASGGYHVGTDAPVGPSPGPASPGDLEILQGVPDDLKMACITQTMYMFNKYREGNVGIVGADKHSPNYEKNSNLLCTEAMGLAAPYKRVLVGRR